ncbi:MAG: hypothetical protein MK171_13600 [Pirellulales bacterium]|nr:hypothetical protein [Pirellulales bacterium]
MAYVMISTKNPSSLAKGNLKVRFLWMALSVCAAILTSGSTLAETRDTDQDPSFYRDQNPAVAAVLQLPRETPGERLQAVITLADLGEAELATKILKELATLDLTADQRAVLVSEFGTAAMLRLARDPQLAADGALFADSCMAAAAQQARDPDRLATLIHDLGSPSAEIRQAARIDLADAGTVAVESLLKALAQETNVSRRRYITQALIALEPLSVGPLLATLTTENPHLLASASEALKALKNSQAAPLLASPEFAELLLLQEINRYLQGVPPFRPDANHQIGLWFWEDATAELSYERYDQPEACILWAARLAEQLVRLDPTNADSQRVALVLGLEAAKLRHGYEQPLSKIPLGKYLANTLASYRDDAQAATQLLISALDSNYPGAATAACELLGGLGDASVLYTPDGQNSPLVRALIGPNRRVSFAALTAIMTLNPQKPFPGSSWVPKALSRFAKGGGPPIALVAMPVIQSAASIGGHLAALGYQADVANNPKDLIHFVRQSDSLQFVLVDLAIGSPGIRELIHTLRSLPQSSGAPIALLAPAGRLAEAHQLASEYDRMVAFPRPQTESTVASIAQTMNDTLDRDLCSSKERIAQAEFALAQLGHLLKQPPGFYDTEPLAKVLTNALYEPNLTSDAIENLAWVGTAESQLTLVDYASRGVLPIESRQVAAAAFAENVRKYGILLTTNEIVRQYDHYNASDTSDEATYRVLSGILDTLESRRQVE